MSILEGVGGVVKTTKEVKVGVGGVVRNVSHGFCGVDSVRRQFFGDPPAVHHIEIFPDHFYCRSRSSSASSWEVTESIYPPNGVGITSLGEYGSYSMSGGSGGDYTQLIISVNPYKLIHYTAFPRIVMNDGSRYIWDPLYYTPPIDITSLSASMRFSVSPIGGFSGWSYSLTLLKNRYGPTIYSDTLYTTPTYTSIPDGNSWMYYFGCASTSNQVVSAYGYAPQITINGKSVPVYYKLP